MKTGTKRVTTLLFSGLLFIIGSGLNGQGSFSSPGKASDPLLSDKDQTSIPVRINQVTDFRASKTTANPMSIITFTDISTSSVTSWHWNFPGGKPSYSEDQNPVIRYDNPGMYDVVLTTSDAHGTNTMTKAAYIVINDTISSLHFDDNCNVSGNWTMGDGSVEWMIIDPSTPPDDHTTGGNCFITNGSIDYGTNRSYILTSPVVDLSGLNGCELTFWMYLEQEGQNSDGGFIELFDGSNWNIVPNTYIDPAYDGTLSTEYSNPYGGIEAWYDDRTSWTKVTVDLRGAGYDGTSGFRIRFKFGADEATQEKTGWAIDHVCISTRMIPDCPSYIVWTGLGGDNNWNSPSNWSDNTVPDGTTNVFIPQYKPGPFYPEAFSNVSVEVFDLFLEPNAVLTIPSGYHLTINGDLTIN